MCVSHHHRLLNYYFSPIFETLPFSPLPLFFFTFFGMCVLQCVEPDLGCCFSSVSSRFGWFVVLRCS